MIQNHSDSLKNVRMMLLLPPGMVAEKFNGMMGFTLRSNEKKNFDVTVKRGGDLDEDRFPVRLIVEYGEMLKHYSGEIKGVMQFSPSSKSVLYLTFAEIGYVPTRRTGGCLSFSKVILCPGPSSRIAVIMDIEW